MQCTNNLKQIGLSVHTFAASRDGLPPIAIMNKGGVQLYLLPYMEQTALSEILTSSATLSATDIYVGDMTGDRAGEKKMKGLLHFPNHYFGGRWMNALPTEVQELFSNVTTWQCPSRTTIKFISSPKNDAGQPIETYTTYWPHSSGPTCAYAAIITRDWNKVMSDPPNGALSRYGSLPTSTGVPDDDKDMLYAYDYTAVCLPNDAWGDGGDADNCWSKLAHFNGGFRAADIQFDATFVPTTAPDTTKGLGCNLWQASAGNFSSWSCRDNFSYWADGTSNMIIMGEKHIPHYAFDPPSDPNYLVKWNGGIGALGTAENQDYSGTSKYFPSQQYANIGRLMGPTTELARGPQDDRCNNWTDKANDAGAYPDINKVDPADAYLFGSAHTGVVNFAVGDGSVHSFSVEISSNILYPLAQADDGVAVAIP
jgi:hypothetical protein